MKPFDQLKILICDDNPKFRMLAMKILKQINSKFVLEEAEDGDVALKKFREFQPHLLILDLMMPKVNGVKVLRDIRASGDEKLIVLIITGMTSEGNDSNDLVIKCMDSGADDFLYKPISFTSLHFKLRHLLKVCLVRHEIDIYEKTLKEQKKLLKIK